MLANALGWGIWGIVALAVMRPVYGRFMAGAAESSRTAYYVHEVDNEERMMFAFMTVLVSALWPAVLVVAALYGWMRGSKFKHPAQREREVEEMRKKIAELEYDLNIGRGLPAVEVKYEPEDDPWWRQYVNHKLIGRSY